MKKTRVLLTTIVFSMFLISCGGGSGGSSSGESSTGIFEPFFADERAMAMEAAKLMEVNDTSLDGLWLAFFVDEEPDGSGKDMDDLRFVFQVSETEEEVTFQLCAGAPNDTATTISKDVNGNIQLPVEMDIFPWGDPPAPVDVSLTSNTVLDFGTWMGPSGTTQTLMAIKIRDDATLPVGTLRDGNNSVELFCFAHSNATETSDGFKTQHGSRSIRVAERSDWPPESYRADCIADHDTNNNVSASIFRPDGTRSNMGTDQGDTIIFQVADNTLTYSCDMANEDGTATATATISYDLK